MKKIPKKPPPHTTDAGGLCPCARTDIHRRPLKYRDCCGRWMEGGAPAPDAESLMRSRYTAFVLERDAYLLATWHPDTRPANLSFTPGAKWLGLEVRHVSPPNDKEPDTAVVEFVARQRLPGCAAVRIHEQSRFVRINTYWVYVDGTDMISP